MLKRMIGRLAIGGMFLSLATLAAPRAMGQEATVEVIGDLYTVTFSSSGSNNNDYMFLSDGGAGPVGICGGGGGINTSASGNEIRELQRWSATGARIANGAVEGAGPTTLSTTITHTRSTVWEGSGTYFASIKYGVTDAVTTTKSATYTVPSGSWGWIKPYESLQCVLWDYFKDGVRLGSGAGSWLEGVKFATGHQ